MTKHIIKSRYIKFCPVIGIGYWKDIYLKEEIGMGGVAHNFVLPFIRIQWGYLEIEKP